MPIFSVILSFRDFKSLFKFSNFLQFSQIVIIILTMLSDNCIIIWITLGSVSTFIFSLVFQSFVLVISYALTFKLFIEYLNDGLFIQRETNFSLAGGENIHVPPWPHETFIWCFIRAALDHRFPLSFGVILTPRSSLFLKCQLKFGQLPESIHLGTMWTPIFISLSVAAAQISATAFSMEFSILCTCTTHPSAIDSDAKFRTHFSTVFPCLKFWPSHPNNFGRAKIYLLSSQASETTVSHWETRVPHHYDLANALEEEFSVTLKRSRMHTPSIRDCSTLSPVLVVLQWPWTFPECTLSRFCSCVWQKHWFDWRYSFMAGTRSPLWTLPRFPSCL